MKNYFHKLASYSALILVSSLPFPVEVFAETDKKPETHSSIHSSDHGIAVNKTGQTGS